jgi:hypothetical protein
MADDPPRTRTARRAAERALVRVVHHYGATPEFVLLGGLVPELLCSSSGMLHAGTTDGSDLVGATRTALDDLAANFENPVAQGPEAYATQFAIDHPDSDDAQLRADAIVAVRAFYAGLSA